MTEKDQHEFEIQVEGMTCSACVRTVRNFLEEQGMEEVYVDLPSRKVSFRSEKRSVDLEHLAEGINRIGYRVVKEAGQSSYWTLGRKLLLAAIFTLPLILGHLLHAAGVQIPFLDNPWVQSGLALPVYIIGFLHFGRSAWGALRARETNMDVLIFLGSTAAFIYSLIGLVLRQPEYYFFETAASIITLVLLGNWIENRALKTTTSALDDLQRMRVDKARLWMGDNHVMEIEAADIRKGDRVMVANGEAVPVDGTVMEGNGEVNESVLTGEAIPVKKQDGDRLLSGSTVVSGSFVLKADVDEADTLFNQIIRLVKAAQSDKPPIHRLADKISAWFVPVVVVISILAFFLGWGFLGFTPGKALMNAIAVLVISCPCAMGLATPTAISVGMGRMARKGLLVKGAGTIEDLARIRQIIFDKTGTLTTGVLKVRQIKAKTGMEALVRQYVYQMEQRSNHPVAKAITAYLGNTVIVPEARLEAIVEEPGIGMQARDGKGHLLTLQRDDYDGGEGYHLALTRDGEKIGHLVLEDELREDAPEIVSQFRQAGYSCRLLSGDHEDNVRRVAERSGIEDFQGRLLPQDKYRRIEEAMDAGPVAMVGDGINDAPALEKATVGIAMAGASHTALRSAKVALLNPRLSDLVALFRLSRLTVRTIRENLFWAFSYNIVAIPLAVAGLLNPMWGALFMAFSDLVVIGNSIRLKYR